MASITDIVKSTAGDIHNTLFYRTAKKTPPDAIIELIDYKAAAAGKKLWRGMLAVMASGFGKGALLAGGLLVAAAMVGLGFSAHAYGFPIGQGVALGLDKALSFLSHGTGLIFLGMGGALGAANEARKAQNNITAEVAAAQAQNFEIARQLGAAKELSPAKPMETLQTVQQPTYASTIPECGHCARELEKRAMAGKRQMEGGIA